MDLVSLLMAGIVFVLAVIVLIHSYLHEKKLWNKGICPLCNTEWNYVDSDSQGGRGYKCECMHQHRVWISWFRVDH